MVNLKIPNAARALFERLVAEASTPWPVLAAQLDRYSATLERASVEHEFFDRELAGRLVGTSRALLELGPALPFDAQRLVQAAVRYFIIKEDGEHDLNSITGLDDDVEVLNAVVVGIGRGDLRILV